MIKTFILLFILNSNVHANNAFEIKEFTSESYQTIINQHKGNFLLVFWSLDCPPCLSELKLLGEYIQKKPNLDIVLVSTDLSHRQNEIINRIDEFKLNELSLWSFSNEHVLRLRHTIDPSWYGELPRSYFFDSNGNRQGLSGALSINRLNTWVSSGYLLSLPAEKE